MHKRYLLLATAVVAVVAAGFFFTRPESASGQVNDAAQFDSRLAEVTSALVVAAEESEREWEQLAKLEDAIAAGQKHLARFSTIMTMQARISVPHDDTEATAYFNAVRELARLQYDHEQGWLNKLQTTRTDAEFELKKGEIRDTNQRYQTRLRELVRQTQNNFARAHGLRLLAATNTKP